MQHNKRVTLKEFTTSLDQQGNHLPFKIMGRRRLPDPKRNINGTYYTATMLKAIYESIHDPDLLSTFQSVEVPFGEILKVGCRLSGGGETYCEELVPNQKTGNNLLQADIVELDLSQAAKTFPRHRLSMITSHSCGIENSHCVSFVPVYTESELDELTVTTLRGDKPKDFRQVRANWLANEQINFLGLPAVDIPKIGIEGERLFACLASQVLLPKIQAPTQPVLRLTYRALSYFQMRIALLFMRDVQDSDDTRAF